MPRFEVHTVEDTWHGAIWNDDTHLGGIVPSGYGRWCMRVRDLHSLPLIV